MPESFPEIPIQFCPPLCDKRVMSNASSHIRPALSEHRAIREGIATCFIAEQDFSRMEREDPAAFEAYGRAMRDAARDQMAFESDRAWDLGLDLSGMAYLQEPDGVLVVRVTRYGHASEVSPLLPCMDAAHDWAMECYGEA